MKNREKTVSSPSGAGQAGELRVNQRSWNTIPTTHRNKLQMAQLNIRQDAIKLLEENTGKRSLT